MKVNEGGSSCVGPGRADLAPQILGSVLWHAMSLLLKPYTTTQPTQQSTSSKTLNPYGGEIRTKKSLKQNLEKQHGTLCAHEMVEDSGAYRKQIQCKGPEVWAETPKKEGRKGMESGALLSLPPTQNDF